MMMMIALLLSKVVQYPCLRVYEVQIHGNLSCRVLKSGWWTEARRIEENQWTQACGMQK